MWIVNMGRFDLKLFTTLEKAINWVINEAERLVNLWIESGSNNEEELKRQLKELNETCDKVFEIYGKEDKHLGISCYLHDGDCDFQGEIYYVKIIN